MPWPAPVTLQGRIVTVEPLRIEHHDGLVDAIRDGELWKLWYTKVPTPDTMRADIERRLGNLCCFGGGLAPLPAWVRTPHRVARWVAAKLVINGLRQCQLQGLTP